MSAKTIWKSAQFCLTFNLLCMGQNLSIPSIKWKNDHFSLPTFWWLEQISSSEAEPICTKFCSLIEKCLIHRKLKIWCGSVKWFKSYWPLNLEIPIFTRFSRVDISVESGDFEKVPLITLLARRDLPLSQI